MTTPSRMARVLRPADKPRAGHAHAAPDASSHVGGVARAGFEFGKIRVQRKPEETPAPIVFYVTVEEPVSGPEFYIRAVMTYTGLTHTQAEQKITAGAFKCSHPNCFKGVSQAEVGTSIAVTIDKLAGMSKGEKASMDKRTREMQSLPPSQRDALNAEADQRFWKATRYKVNDLLGTGPEDARMREIWLRMREGVLRDRDAVAVLPLRVRGFLAPNNATIAPKDYAIVLRIAKKLESFSDEDWALYERRVTVTTDDYARVERSLMNFRAQQLEEKATIERLRGTENVFTRARSYEGLRRYMFTPSLKTDALPYNFPGNKEKLEAAEASLHDALSAAQFESVDQYDIATGAYLKLFRKRAVELTLLALRASEKTILLERRRYENPNVNEALLQALSPALAASRASHEASRKAILTPMQLKTDAMPTDAQWKAAETAGDKSAEAASERSKLSDVYPILKDPKLATEDLDVDDATALGVVLRKDADDRLESIEKTRQNVLKDNDRIFDLPPILALTRTELAVTDGDIYDLIVKDYQSHLRSQELFASLALAVLGIGLGLLTFGGGAYAIAGIAGSLLLGAHTLDTEWEKYSDAQAAAHTDFDVALSVSSEEPSLVWVALALLGIGLDGAALAGAFKASIGAAKALEAGSGLTKFETALKDTKVLTEQWRETLVTAGHAQEEYRLAVENFKAAMRQTVGRVYSLGLDPDVVDAVMKLAYAAVKKGVRDVQSFLAELKLQKYAQAIDFSDAKQLELLTTSFERAQQTLIVPFQKGQKLVTFDEAGRMIMDGKRVSFAEKTNIYKTLGYTHAVEGHVLKDVKAAVDAAKSEKVGLSGIVSDREFIYYLRKAEEQFRAGNVVRPAGTMNVNRVYLEVSPDVGRAFAVPSKVPPGVVGIPVEGFEGILEIPVKRILVVFRDNGSLKSFYPIGF